MVQELIEMMVSPPFYSGLVTGALLSKVVQQIVKHLLYSAMGIEQPDKNKDNQDNAE